MTEPVATLRSLLDTLGGTVVEVLAAPRGLDVPARRVVVNDPDDVLGVEPGDVVLGVGAGRGRELVQLLRELAAAEAAALVLRTGGQPDPEVLAEAGRGSVALLAVPPISAWAQVAQLVTAALSRGELAGDERLAGVQGGDLFALANVIAELVDGPVTIEDNQSRVVAYSGRQDEADAARAATVLGRRVPAAWLDRLHEQGVFARLAGQREPIYVDSIGPEVVPRLAVAIRAGDVVLGSVWAAVPRGRPSPQTEAELADVAGFVALHMLRQRLTSDVRRGLERQLVGSLLDGGALAADAATRLGLATAAGFRVVALEPRDPAAGEAEQLAARCRDNIAVHLAAPHRGARSVVAGGVVYAVVPVAAADPGRTLDLLREQLHGLVARLGATLGAEVVAGIGSHAAGVAEIVRSRATADEVLRVLRDEPQRGPVADLDEVRSVALLGRFTRMMAGDPLAAAGPLPTLQEHDARRHTGYVATLRAYLDAFGDVETVAAGLGVHANTVRYRLRQMQSLVGIDLRNPTDRLALMLQLQAQPVLEVAKPLVPADNRARRPAV